MSSAPSFHKSFQLSYSSLCVCIIVEPRPGQDLLFHSAFYACMEKAQRAKSMGDHLTDFKNTVNVRSGIQWI